MVLGIFLGISILVAVISNAIQYQYQVSTDFAAYLIDDYGWVNILSCVGVSGIVAGFIFWSWKIMLIILSSLIVLGVIAGVIVWIILNRRDNYEDDEFEGEEILISSNKSVYKCKNCGAILLKQVIENYAGKKTRYFCEHCEASGTLKEVKDNKQVKEEPPVEIEINDFEEEYFDACIVMGFRPHNKHTQKQIDRKYDKLMEQIENYEISWESDDRDDEDILDEAYDFFSENQEEILEYLSKEKEEDIRKKYEYYIFDDEDDE